MFGQVIPLAMTQVSWNLFIKLATEITGESPTRGLDARNLDKGPASFAQCIDLKNTPFAALREYNPHLAHFSLVFMVEGDDEFSRAIQLVREVMVTSPAAGVFYVSAPIDQWVSAILKINHHLLPSTMEELQQFLTVVYGIFRSIGYKDLFTGKTVEIIHNNITLLK